MQDTGLLVEKIENYSDPGKNFYRSSKLSFTWLVKSGNKELRKREHHWNLKNGDYEVITKDEKGNELNVRFNINTRKGLVFKAGKQLKENIEKYLESAYAWYINDSYWLVMPLKMRDNGVILKEEKSIEYDHCLHMSFKQVGLTPGDQYWIYFSKDGEIKRWKFKLEGGKEGDFIWKDYRNIGNSVKFAGIKESKSISIEFENIKLE